jgi:hypothetical protein
MLGAQGASRAGIIRSALALFHGHDRATAVKYARSDQREDTSGREHIVARIPDELPVPDKPAWAIRVGLGMAMGMNREQAEWWATTTIPQGRPSKSSTAMT